MKRQTKLLVGALAVSLLMPVMNGCKKGPDDPFLSLKSRKSRVAGEWTIASMVEELSTSYATSSGSSGNGSSTTEIDGEDFSMRSTDTDGGFTSTVNGSGDAETSVVFDKDGTFSMEMEFSNVNVTVNSGGSSTTMQMKITREMSGTWDFLGGVSKDYKNKERIVLNIHEEVVNSMTTADGGYSENSSETYTYADGEMSQVWHITQLKNKEMIIEGTVDGGGNYSNTTSFGGSSSTSSGSSSTSGSTEIVLTQN